ncbi:hypothetical protein V5799_005911 [Amblyomma americanum]|uniref:Acyltransferase required for palmitoylation of hedgehog hh family of secreted signaling n=1 Tax=Amblyomma americanum TaxID=6943 RepID=A0AAQ4DXW6_AMBAM
MTGSSVSPDLDKTPSLEDVPNKLAAILHKWQILLKVVHWSVWTSGLIYVLGCFVTSETNSTLPRVAPDEFVDGSFGIPRDKDTADEEWYRYSTAIRKFWIWVLVQPLVSHCLFMKYRSWLPTFYAAYSTFFLLCNVGWLITASFYTLYIAFFISARHRSIVACYFLGLAVIAHSAFPVLTFLKPVYLYHGSVETFLTQVGLSWTAARCVSFAVDAIRMPASEGSPKVDTTLAYVLYLPAMFTGPLQNFSDFAAQVAKPKEAWSSRDVLRPMVQIGLCTAYFFLLEALLHWFYSSALAYYPDLVEEMDDPSLLGLGICLTVLFFLKYRILYGLGSSVAGLEGLDLPAPPKCVSRIHLCSYLWRHFDRGLYVWIQRYIYRPIAAHGGWSLKHRLMGAAASFAFVCTWHGMDRAVVVWCTLNFLGISTELLTGLVRKQETWQSIEKAYFTGAQLQFLRAAVSTPHFLFSMFSCMFFLSNVDIGLIFLRRVIFGYPVPLVPTLLVMYCGCHVSIDIMDWEVKKKKS